MSNVSTVGSLFTGIGGIDLGLERAGWTIRWQVECDEWCRAVLAKHWPHVKRYGDVSTVGTELEPVDLIAGGFPCQPVSVAGRRRGTDDERWLWSEFCRVVRLLRPRYVLVENVPGLLTGPIGHVLGDLAALGYDAEWTCIPAASVGAPHLRWRVFIVAYAYQQRLQERGLHGEWRAQVSDATGGGRSDEALADADRSPRGSAGSASQAVFRSGAFQRSRRRDSGDGDQWAVEPPVGRVADGIPQRVDRLRGLGNAVVPQVAEAVGKMILEHMQ